MMLMAYQQAQSRHKLCGNSMQKISAIPAAAAGET